MTFDEWFQNEQGEAMSVRDVWNLATEREREACAKAAEVYTEEGDDRQWIPGSLYDTLRRDVAAFIRKRSKAQCSSVVASLRQTTSVGQPVAFAVFADNGNIRIWSTNCETVRKLAEEEGVRVTPLYALASCVNTGEEEIWK